MLDALIPRGVLLQSARVRGGLATRLIDPYLVSRVVDPPLAKLLGFAAAAGGIVALGLLARQQFLLLAQLRGRRGALLLYVIVVPVGAGSRRGGDEQPGHVARDPGALLCLDTGVRVCATEGEAGVVTLAQVVAGQRSISFFHGGTGERCPVGITRLPFPQPCGDGPVGGIDRFRRRILGNLEHLVQRFFCVHVYPPSRMVDEWADLAC